MTLQPATISNQLFDRVTACMNQQVVSELELKALERDAKKLENANRAEGLIARSAVAALKWDVDQAQALCRDALCNRSTLLDYLNAAVTMGYVNRPDLAATFIDEASKRFGLVDDVVGRAVLLNYAVADLEKAAAVYRKSASLGQASPDFVNPEAVLAGVRQLGISQGRLQAELQAAFDVLTDHKRRYAAITAELVSDMGLEALVMTIYFEGSDEDVLAMEASLAERLVDLPEWDPRTLSVEFARVAHAH